MPGFNPNKNKEEVNFQVNKDNLSPDGKDLKTLEKKSFEDQFRIQAEAKTKNLKAMNALKTVAPILMASLSLSQNENENLDHFRATSKKIDEMASKILKGLSLDEVQFKWAKNQIERGLAETYASLLKTNKSFNISAFDELLPDFVNLLLEKASEKEMYQSLSSELNIKIAVLGAVNKIYLEMAEWGKNKDFQDEVMEALKLSLELTENSIKNLSHKILSEKDRGELFKALLIEMVKAVIFYWKHASRDKMEKIIHLKPQIKNYVTRIEKIIAFLIKD